METSAKARKQPPKIKARAWKNNKSKSMEKSLNPGDKIKMER